MHLCVWWWGWANEFCRIVGNVNLNAAHCVLIVFIRRLVFSPLVLAWRVCEWSACMKISVLLLLRFAHLPLYTTSAHLCVCVYMSYHNQRLTPIAALLHHFPVCMWLHASVFVRLAQHLPSNISVLIRRFEAFQLRSDSYVYLLRNFYNRSVLCALSVRLSG